LGLFDFLEERLALHDSWSLGGLPRAAFPRSGTASIILSRVECGREIDDAAGLDLAEAAGARWIGEDLDGLLEFEELLSDMADRPAVGVGDADLRSDRDDLEREVEREVHGSAGFTSRRRAITSVRRGRLQSRACCDVLRLQPVTWGAPRHQREGVNAQRR